MQRIGRTNMPAYRVVVVPHTVGPKSGKIVEKVGTYNPKTKERTLNADRINYWISVGAQPSDTVHNMLVSAGIVKGTKINVRAKNAGKAAEVKAA
jgi:small subunit ribosomal protein S16